MTTPQLLVALSESEGISHQDAKKIIGIILDSISEALMWGETVQIRGFGSFSAKNYDSYIGRNPKTGVAMVIGARKLPIFRPSKELRDGINGL